MGKHTAAAAMAAWGLGVFGFGAGSLCDAPAVLYGADTQNSRLASLNTTTGAATRVEARELQPAAGT